MNDRNFSWPLFERVPVIGIVRNFTMEELIHILPLYVDAGLTTIEITMNTPGAKEMIRFAIEHYGSGLNIGAGTVCTKEDLKKAVAAGAQFIVTPILKKDLIRFCIKREIPIFPGGFTPSEIYKAWSWGAPMVKLFPAKTLGPDYIKDIKAPLSEIKLIPTGGVDIDNLESFKKAGADGFGIGSPLFKKNLIQTKDWTGLKEHFKRFVQVVNASS